jgi:hypothetical protein
LSESFLRHWELTAQDFSEALSFEEFRAAWVGFRRPGDRLVVYNQGTARLLDRISEEAVPCLLLKGLGADPQRRFGTLEELLAAEGLVAAPARHPGRAGKRLANAVAMVQHLNAFGGKSSTIAFRSEPIAR